MQIPLSIFIVLLLIILLIGCKMAKKGEFHEDFMGYSVIKGLQGFAALVVILHHVTQDVTQYGSQYKGAINIFVDAGVLFTGLFFFCSGYGLIASLKTKEDYLQGFLKKRLPAVIVPFYVCNLLFVLVYVLVGHRMSPLDLLLGLSGLVMYNDQMWFIVELAILYIIFYFSFRKRKSDADGLRKMAVFMIIMCVISWLLGHDGLPEAKGLWFFGEWWYNTTWLFFVGMLVAMNYDKITGFAKKNYKWLLPVAVVLFIALHFATKFMLSHVGYWTEYPGHRGYLEKLGTFLVQCPMVIVFDLTFILLSMKLQFKNRILSFLGVIALEMYLLQNIFITTLTHVIRNDVLFFVAVYAATIVLAILVHKLNQWLIGYLKQKMW